MKPYNDKVSVFGTQNNVAAKVWARKLYKEAQKASVFAQLKPSSGPATFTNKDIKRWWNHRKLGSKRLIRTNAREEAKRDLSDWFSVEYEKKLLESLTKEELPNVGTTSNTKQTGNDRRRRAELQGSWPTVQKTTL